MSISTANANAASAPARGFDRPVVNRAADYLNRWPFSREIYGIATTGPRDWSVRVGIYGEWGTGKTSVLKFIASMAEDTGHIVIWFDPWQHSNKPELWQAFVQTVFKELESKLGQVPGADQARRKAWMEKAKGIVVSVTSVLNEKAGKAVDAGLDLVKKHFAFSQDDLKSLQAILGEKRVIVLIDDLDRTAPELVPEILFVLKELMDIPGFSFVCAFDPVVVGEVLGAYHPGFGDGLKFLDKIIDYPRWLPSPSAEGLTKLALADASHFCEYVPESALRDAIPLLPANPRAIRQFIRLLALLKPQIQRHYEHELRWPAIIAANILKVRHPRIAHALLSDSGFWDSMGMVRLALRGENEQEKVREAVDKHIEKTSGAIGIALNLSEQREIRAAMVALTSQMGLSGGLHGESVAYQFNIAEGGSAVTWKEFDGFLRQWQANQDTDTVKTWIGSHASEVQRGELDVYREILRAAAQRYAEVLRQADDVFTETDKPALVDEATSLLALLDCLVFDLGQLTNETKQIGNSELEILVDKFASFAGVSLTVHAQFWARNEAFILKLFEQWSPDVMPLISILRPYVGMRLRNFDGEAAGELHKKLCAVVLPHFASQVIASFRQSGFVDRIIRQEDETYETRCMIWDANGPIWSALRREVVQAWSDAPSNRPIQENAYELLYWFILAREGHVPQDHHSMERLLSDQAIFDSVWRAATASSLAPRAVYRIREVPSIMKRLGVQCEVPPWWQQTVATFTVSVPPTAATNGDEPDAPTEERS